MRLTGCSAAQASCFVSGKRLLWQCGDLNWGSSLVETFEAQTLSGTVLRHVTIPHVSEFSGRSILYGNPLLVKTAALPGKLCRLTVIAAAGSVLSAAAWLTSRTLR